MARKPKPSTISELDTYGACERLTGVPRNTLRAAAERGELQIQQLASGTPVIRVADAEAWRDKADQRKPGPKPASE